MFLLLLTITTLAAAGIASTIAALRNDGYHRVRTDWRQVP